eukprot:2633648-Pleurochrysis_carterae.AAC.1
MSNAHTQLLKSRIDVHPVTRSQLLSKSWLVTNYQGSRTVCLVGVSAYQAHASYVAAVTCRTAALSRVVSYTVSDNSIYGVFKSCTSCLLFLSSSKGAARPVASSSVAVDAA